VLLDDVPIDSWDGHLPRLLFFFALDMPRITREEICKSFWPEMDLEQAVNVFHVTKRRLHKALGFDVLVHDQSSYQINPSLNLCYDALEMIEELLVSRHGPNADDPAHLQRCVDLYRGPYLQGHDEDWVRARRERYQQGYLEALSRLAVIRQRQGRTDLALPLIQRALAVEPGRDDLHRDLIRLFTELGRRSEAVAHYRLVEAQKARVDQMVDPETFALIEAITA
jgi:two-component SAPR family response regulator